MEAHNAIICIGAIHFLDWYCENLCYCLIFVWVWDILLSELLWFFNASLSINYICDMDRGSEHCKSQFASRQQILFFNKFAIYK